MKHLVLFAVLLCFPAAASVDAAEVNLLSGPLSSVDQNPAWKGRGWDGKLWTKDVSAEFTISPGKGRGWTLANEYKGYAFSIATVENHDPRASIIEMEVEGEEFEIGAAASCGDDSGWYAAAERRPGRLKVALGVTSQGPFVTFDGVAQRIAGYGKLGLADRPCLRLKSGATVTIHQCRLRPTVKVLVDLTHQWSFFYCTGFGRSYLAPMGMDYRSVNRGLAHLDLSSVNLLILPYSDAAVEYSDPEIAAIQSFARSGGGVLLISSPPQRSGGDFYALNRVARRFGCEFPNTPARPPLVPTEAVGDGIGHMACEGNGRVLRLNDPKAWSVLVTDKGNVPIVAIRRYGQGGVAAVAAGEIWPDNSAKGPAMPASNVEFTQRLLHTLARGRPFPAAFPFDQPFDPECAKLVGGVRFIYPTTLSRTVDDVIRLYRDILPVQERFMGVPIQAGFDSTIQFLATGAGGYSAGTVLGIGVFWGGWPRQRYPMIELIGHESTHSWVLPFSEPLGNEAMATYVGIELGKRMGLSSEAKRARWEYSEAFRKLDPTRRKLDVAKPPSEEAVKGCWGKTMFIIDALRESHGDAVFARYFQLKRRYADPKVLQEFTLDDSVFLWGMAAKTDLFPWFRNDLGIEVAKERSKLAELVKNK